MQRINRSKKGLLAAAAVMFLIMLVCNCMTDMFADDFHYLYRFDAQYERVDSVADVFSSMKVHGEKMNGRFLAHGLAQLFLMLPPMVFDVVNALMFVLQVYIVYRLAKPRNEESLFLFALVFAAFWLFELAFGQVNLWLVGSCNYLWGSVVCLLFLLPFVEKLLYDKNVVGVLPHILWLLLSFAAGAYSENASAAMIFTAFLICCYMLFVQKRKPRFYYVAAPITAFAGFICMMSAPYMQVASNDFDLWSLFKAFGRAGNMFYKMWPIVLGFAVLFTIGCFARLRRECLALAFFLAVGGVFAEIIMMFAEYNVERRAFFTFALLLTACALLFAELIRSEKYKLLLTCCGVCMLTACLYFVSLGMSDMAITHRDVLANESYIARCRAEGQMEVTLSEVNTRTNYNALTGIQYLNADHRYWLNRCMAKYYGVDAIHMAEKQ